MKLTLAVMFACAMSLGTVAVAADRGLGDAVDGVLTINSSGDYRLVADFKQLVVQGPTANDVIDVTVDMNGHSISNTEKNVLVDIAENKSTVTLTLTNCADRTSYIDGLFAFNEWKSGADYGGTSRIFSNCAWCGGGICDGLYTNRTSERCRPKV